jgi:BirA family biotin operon repressor/biotin-[acetyl-CoA-carboxylase] ligase
MIPVHRYTEVDSTNAEALRLWTASAGEAEPFAVVAELQTAGRGRSGRSWASPAGGLWLSIAWPLILPVAAYQSIPLVVGLAVAESIESLFHLKVRIKWPNDVLLEAGKVAGVLCQTDTRLRGGVLIAGVGINANCTAADLPPGLRAPATTLRDALGFAIDQSLLEDDLIPRCVGLFSQFETEGLVPFLPGINRRLAWLHEKVSVGLGDSAPPLEGIIQGVNADGALLLLVGDEIKKVISGDVDRVRPV